MPWSPAKPCAYPGCGKLVHARHCPEHALTIEHRRGKTAERGYGARWQRYREQYLQQHPLCAECERCDHVTASTVVDHIIPHRGDQRLFWEPTNHQALCKPHHDAKTGRGG